jgi:ComF family protein
MMNLPYSKINESEFINRLSIFVSVNHVFILFDFEQDNIIQKLIHKFKYYDKVYLGKFLAHMMFERIKDIDWIKDIDVIIPLPLHWSRQMKRGYNQSEVLARYLGKALKKPVETHCIVRKVKTKSQARQGKDRWQNMDSAFVVRKPHLINGKHILIIDDVITSGSSLANCLRSTNTVKNCTISVAGLSALNKYVK